MSQDRRDMIDVMVSIMRNKRSGNRAVEMAASVIAADARFNDRVGKIKSSVGLGDDLIKLVEFADDIWTECQVIERQFQDGMVEVDLIKFLSEVILRLERAYID